MLLKFCHLFFLISHDLHGCAYLRIEAVKRIDLIRFLSYYASRKLNDRRERERLPQMAKKRVCVFETIFQIHIVFGIFIC